MPKGAHDRREAIVRNLPEKTGKSVLEWAALVRSADLPTRKERIDWLEREHGLGSVQAAVVVDHLGRGEDYVEPSSDEWLDAQYSGPRESLRTLYERLRGEFMALGADVRMQPRQTYVSFSAERQFAVLQPSAGHIDVGLVLPGVLGNARLREAGSFGSGSVTHRVSVGSEDEVDEQLREWLAEAYRHA